MRNIPFFLLIATLVFFACKNEQGDAPAEIDSESTFDASQIKASLDSVLRIRDSLLIIRNGLSAAEISKDALLRYKVNEFDAQNQGIDINQDQFKVALEYFENGTFTIDQLEEQCLMRKENAISTIKSMEKIAFVYFTPDN